MVYSSPTTIMMKISIKFGIWGEFITRGSNKNGFRILFQQIESKDYLENQEVCNQVHKIIQIPSGKMTGRSKRD